MLFSEFESKNPLFFSFLTRLLFSFFKNVDLKKLNRNNAAMTRARPASAPSRSLCSEGGTMPEEAAAAAAAEESR